MKTNNSTYYHLTDSKTFLCQVLLINFFFNCKDNLPKLVSSWNTKDCITIHKVSPISHRYKSFQKNSRITIPLQPFKHSIVVRIQQISSKWLHIFHGYLLHLQYSFFPLLRKNLETKNPFRFIHMPQMYHVILKNCYGVHI